MSINVIAFNCSPNEDHGNTGKVLEPLLDGMKLQGANVELYYTHRMNIARCLGCTEDPTFVTTGKCKVVDDMKYIYPKMKNADIWIFATPNYQKIINQSLINLFDRLEPLFESVTDFTNGTNLVSKDTRIGKILLLSTGNDFDTVSFNKLIEHVESLAVLFNREYLGTITRPHAWILNGNDYIPQVINGLFNSLSQAGKEIINTGKLSKKTLKEINKDLVNKKSFIASLLSEMD
jgi:multimeric flavodoxin WrbA